MIIGLDVGGTHTDVVLVGDDGLVNAKKVPTDPDDLFHTVLSGLEEMTRNVELSRIQRIVLSTTLTTNAIAQRKIPPVGMIVSSGPGIDPEYFRTHAHYHAVSGAIDHRGREVAPIDEKEIRRLAEKLKGEHLDHVGVVGKFSVRNPRHEILISRILEAGFDRVFMGHLVSGNLNFARRIATTYLNTAVYPIHAKFFNAVKRSLSEKGIEVPIYILKADGGTMTLEASMAYPGQTILSGPAASVMGSVAFAPRETESMVMDIGGTTTDMAIIRNGIPSLHPIGARVGNFRTLIRSLETRSIGCGGDSAVRVKDGQLEVGPDREGPAMAFGGSVPTPTDALVVMGRMQTGNRDKASAGLAEIAAALGMSLDECARTVFDRTCRIILSEARALVDRINSRPVYTVQEIQEGSKVNPRTLLILGGPAPFFAQRLEALSGWQTGVVPHWEVANAIGAALARTTCEVSLLADTQLGTVTAPEENYREKIGRQFGLEDGRQKAFELLKSKALQIGGCDADIQMEVLEEQQFNMVRGFLTTGKNIRVKVQVKPGLIHAYETIAERLSE
jgi:N-methylhydantoinase A/oxoprolinase/acetone carboxylase beta subunit